MGTVADEVLHFKSNYLLIILIDRYETYFEIKTDSLFIHGENFRILRAYLVFISNFRKWRNGRQRHLPAIKPILHQSNSAIRLWRFSFFLSFMFFFFFLFVCNFGTGEMAATLFPPPIPSPPLPPPPRSSAAIATLQTAWRAITALMNRGTD